MNLKLNKTTRLVMVCIIGALMSTCKKDLVYPEVSRETLTLKKENFTSLSASYQVSTFIEGQKANGTNRVSFPQRICSAADGNMYVTSPNGFVYKLNSDGEIYTLLNINSVSGIKAGANGAVYLTIAKSSLPPHTVGRIVKIDKNRFVSNVLVNITLNSPKDLAIAPDSTLYVVDQGNQCILKVKKDGTSTVFAGKTGQSGNSDGQGESARFNNPSYIRYANDGTLWVIDGNSQSIRKITLDGNVITFYKLNPSQQSTIYDLAVTKRDKDFNLSPNENAFISISRSAIDEPSSQRKYQILHLSHNKVLTPITSLSLAGSRNGDALQSTFNYPSGLTVNSNGIFVADLVNNKIRKITRR